MGKIKAVYRYIDEMNREKFKQAQCLLTISVGQEVHEDEKFEATIQLINTTFRSCIMLVDDTLQRHTMAINQIKSPQDLQATSLDEGNQWLVRNEKYFSQLNNLSKIIRWDMWLKHEQYERNQNIIKQLIEDDIVYKKLFHITIDEFLTRYVSRVAAGSYFNYERAYQLCLDYLIEECTAMTLWPELNCHFEVYPSRRNPVMDETHKRFVLPEYPNLLHAVAVKFKNRKQLKPQHFKTLEIDYNKIRDTRELA
ncbi:MAG: hypothetical protein NTW08_02690 [Gammaproteobacteria bacterium]|nr:hypothetical protein [Gammaproteobacteria bacterium]